MALLGFYFVGEMQVGNEEMIPSVEPEQFSQQLKSNIQLVQWWTLGAYGYLLAKTLKTNHKQ